MQTLENTGKGEKSMAKKVTVIKAAKAQKHTQEERRLKVCGYARVSTGSQAQATSYTAQVEYYTEKIPCGSLQGCMRMKESAEQT